MANVDKGRSKWEDNSQDVQDMRLRDDMKGNRRGKPQVEIYRPGSGPLRKSAQGDEETVFVDNVRRAKSSIDNSRSSSVSEEFKRGGKKPMNSFSQEHVNSNSKRSSDVREPADVSKHSKGLTDIEDRVRNVHLSTPVSSFKDQRNSLDHASSGGSTKSVASDTKKKNRKPEQALYIPKPLAQAIAERDVANKSPVDVTEGKSASNVNCSKEKNNVRGEKECLSQPVQEECWDDETSQCAHSDYSNKEVRSQRSEVCDRNDGSQVGRGESFRRMKYEGNRKSGRGASEKDWVDKGMGNGTVKQGGGSSSKSGECKPHSMRYSGNRKNCQSVEGDLKNQEDSHASWNSDMSATSQYNQRRNDLLVVSREIRQASEPRALPPTSLSLDVNRIRDTRSVEPVGTSGGRGWNGDKLQAKPPSGRRGSVKDCGVLPSVNKNNPKPHPCYDSLPPRLKKKYLAESMVSSSNYIGTTSEDVWDGSTVTFQGSGGNYHQHHHVHQQHQPPAPHSANQTQELSPCTVQYGTQEHWAHTLPNSRVRGRGRLRPDELEMARTVAATVRFSRSLTPDRLSMPLTSSCDPPSPGRGFRRVPSQESLLQSDHRKGMGSSVKTPPQSPPPPPLSTSSLSTSKGPPLEERKGTAVKPSSVHSSRYRRRSDGNPTEPGEMYRNRRHNENKCQSKGNVQRPYHQESTAGASFDDILRNSPSPKILDWGEEVEQSERLEAEGMLSDVMTRSSSPASLQEKIQTHPPKERRKRHRRRGGEARPVDDRSLSRGRSIKEQSKDQNRGYSGDRSNRGSSHERNYGSYHNRGTSKERSNRGYSRERSNRGPNKEGSNRDQSKERSNTAETKERSKRERNVKELDRNYRGCSQDRNYRGHSRDRSNRGQNHEHHEKDRLKETIKKHENWREEQRQQQQQQQQQQQPLYQQKRENKEQETVQQKESAQLQKGSSGSNVAGILVIPSHADDTVQPNQMLGYCQSQDQLEYSSSYPVFRGCIPNPGSFQQQQQQRQLFDPNNPSKPIIVSSPGARAVQPLPSRESDVTLPVPGAGFISSHPPELGYVQYSSMPQCPDGMGQGSYVTDQFGNTRPTWYDPYSSSFRSARNPHLLLDIERADLELQWILSTGGILRDWNRVVYIRQYLQQCLHTLLVTDIKFCQTENVEQHLWKILFYNIIELLRKSVAENAESKEQYKQTMLTLIDQGTSYFENLLEVLEQTYKFKLETFLSANTVSTKGLGFAGLALISAQKIFLFLGDLARYKEQVNETSNFGKSRQCYIKAHQINPKNGRPYNQLAILAVYARRKLDAVYYYMRSLMASNPFQSARESLLSLFDESRKKYEQAERKRREERDIKQRERMKEKEGAGKECGGNGLRREYWVHPEGGRPRLHITTSTVQDQRSTDSEEEELAMLSSIEVNKRFVTSYLHVHGKLFTKIGMETFQEAALQMLREFRALLQHSPVPLNANRFLQLLALNMFAIENTQLKEAAHLEPGYRSAVQESALVVSLQMFNLILEKCVSLLREQLERPTEAQSSRLIVSEDMQVLLPAVKVWCDWLLCHSSVWNPPPSCVDYRVGPPGDAWGRVASLVNLLEKLECQKTILVTGPKEDYELVRLPEDATLCGFTPLMYNDQEPVCTSKETDMEQAHVVLRIRKIVFFGTVFLCGVDPPVLKLQKFDSGFSEYVSVVQSSSQGSPSSLHEEDQSDSELVVESFSEDEDGDKTVDKEGKMEPALSASNQELDPSTEVAPVEIQNLLHRKEELEKRHRRQERHRQRVQAILRDSVVSVEIEVKPHNLVPDTNCFIDYLSQLQIIAQAGPAQQHYYTLMVPLVVLKELEGLARRGKDRDYIPLPPVDPEHAAKVAEAAKLALVFLRSRSPGVRCVTSRGTVIHTSAFAMEEDSEQDERNDDKILTTSLSLCRSSGRDQSKPGEPRRLYREVVLLTKDRNLRVKALARHVPVREVPDFMQWAGLG